MSEEAFWDQFGGCCGAAWSTGARVIQANARANQFYYILGVVGPILGSIVGAQISKNLNRISSAILGRILGGHAAPQLPKSLIFMEMIVQNRSRPSRPGADTETHGPLVH